MKFLEKLKRKKQEKNQIQQQKKYYEILRSGALFLQFINQDLQKMKKNKMNRPQRRRFEKSLRQKGTFTPELIDHYKQRIEDILKWVNQNENK